MISIIVPCYNEAESLPLLADAVFKVLSENSIDGEMVVVDDNSPDGTGQIAEELGKKYNVKTVHREKKAGLSGAVMAGIDAASGDIIGVMDADLSHDPAIIPRLVKPLEENRAQVSIGSRHVPGGGSDHWPLIRRFISKTAILMGRIVTDVRDVTSGYFFFRREIIKDAEINPIGFKIGLEIFVKASYEHFIEIPFIFKDRQHGQSKLGRGEVVNYLKHLAALRKFLGEHKDRKRPTAVYEQKD
ncbi:MAG: polyprenol monophosphomannose synthase [bacterium]|nr:polyprenol monophosphomannose synthase [bacterium]